ncbi:GNAT family N-acetyltransferase [Maribellus comscasis]|uniref:GNAT family N-acetyltransferase n=1 Tax=Maribellus comscasis TaxID=2681766 RepID=A0A6I6K5D5_9BACT|nr:GNAT family N-acetyltransferase [Maribellus comscasis]QGY47937.1 GNAT family N-acetyltransferase [Maribellus comscasis]
MEEYSIKPFKQGNEKAVHQLVKTVYDEFVRHENTEEGNLLFYDWIMPQKIAARQKQQNNLWLAWSSNKIIGMMEIRDNQNITLLFVDKNYQKRGIARNLFQTALNEYKKREFNLDKFYVHASLSSVPVYKSLGFNVVSKARKENGIYYVSMETNIS